MDESIYRVKDWDRFENERSRQVDQCKFVCVPNKQDGMGFLRIMQEPDGAAIYGIWVLILEVCSRQKRPRTGCMTDGGAETDDPMSLDDLSVRWRRPVAEIERAIAVLSSHKVGWLEQLGAAHVQPPSNPRRTHDAPTTNPPERKKERTEGTEGTEQKEPPESETENIPHKKTHGEEVIERLEEQRRISRERISASVSEEEIDQSFPVKLRFLLGIHPVATQASADLTTLSRIYEHVVTPMLKREGRDARRKELLDIAKDKRLSDGIENKVAAFVAEVKKRYGDWKEPEPEPRVLSLVGKGEVA